jgi:WD40 repeat protein
MTETRLLIKDGILLLWIRDRTNQETKLDDSKFKTVLHVDTDHPYCFNWCDTLCATYTILNGKEHVSIWDLETGKRILNSEYEYEVENHMNFLPRDAFQMDNQKYLSANNGVRQYDIRTGTVVQKWNTSSPLNFCLEYHNNTIAVSLEDGLAFYDFR